MASDDQIMVKSSEGRVFAISKSGAALSDTISAAVEKLSTSTSSAIEIPIPNVDGKTLDIVVNYLNVQAGAMKKFHGEFLLPGEMKTQDLIDIGYAANSLKLHGLKHVVCGELEARRKNCKAVVDKDGSRGR